MTSALNDYISPPPDLGLLTSVALSLNVFCFWFQLASCCHKPRKTNVVSMILPRNTISNQMDHKLELELEDYNIHWEAKCISKSVKMCNTIRTNRPISNNIARQCTPKFLKGTLISSNRTFIDSSQKHMRTYIHTDIHIYNTHSHINIQKCNQYLEIFWMFSLLGNYIFCPSLYVPFFFIFSLFFAWF